jgi:HK97 family phage major capsid protein
MTTEEVIKALESKLEEKGFASKNDVDTIKASIEELKSVADQTALKAAFDKLEAEISALKEVSVQVGKDRSMTPIKKALVENKERIESLKSNGGKFEVEIETKATHNPTDIADRNELGQFEPEVSKIPHRKVYMEQLFQQGTASTEYIKYVEEATVVRDAKNVAACATSTHNSKVTFAVKDLQMKKVRDYTQVCIDMMDDYSFVETEIRHLVTSGVQLKKDADLLLGDGLGANINGVDSYASTFNAAAVGANYANTVFNPQLIDLLVVAGAQIKAFGQQNFFMPNVIILNPKDATLMGLLKDGEENYIKMGSVNASVFRDANGQLYINGMLVVENPNCPENEAYIFDSTKGRYYRRRGMVVEFAYENGTNFEQELVTVKAYERGNLRVRNNDANAFMHIDDIAAGIAAIERT